MSFNAKDMTQGGQIASMRIRMFSQIANIIVYCLVILFGVIVALTLSIKLTWQTFVNWIGPYISIHFLSLNPLLVRRRRYSRGERYPSALCGCHSL